MFVIEKKIKNAKSIINEKYHSYAHSHKSDFSDVAYAFSNTWSNRRAQVYFGVQRNFNLMTM